MLVPDDRGTLLKEHQGTFLREGGYKEITNVLLGVKLLKDMVSV